MAKSTRHGGASYTDHEQSDPDVWAIVSNRPVLGGELQSVGTNSSQSTERQVTSGDKQKPPDHKPAQTTENPSSPPPMETDSDVDSTAGDGPKTETESSRKRGAPARTKGKKPALDEEF